jgi:hypothetical protein
MTWFIQMFAISGMGVKRALDDFNRSGPPVGDDMMLWVLGGLLVIGAASAWGVWKLLHHKGTHDTH